MRRKKGAWAQGVMVARTRAGDHKQVDEKAYLYAYDITAQWIRKHLDDDDDDVTCAQK